MAERPAATVPEVAEVRPGESWPGGRPAGHQAARARLAAGFRAAPAAGGAARRGPGTGAGAGLRPGRVRQDGAAGRLGPALASGRWRGCRWMPATTTRPGSGGMRWPRWTGRGRGSASGWARCSARPPPLVRGAGDGPDQRAGRPARRGRGAAGPRRLPPDRLPAGARVARVPARAPAAGPAPGAGQPRRPAAGRWRGCGPAGS